MGLSPDSAYDKKHRDPALVERLSRALTQAKQSSPHMRIGQIVENALTTRPDVQHRPPELFNVEDDELVLALERYVSRAPRQGA